MVTMRVLWCTQISRFDPRGYNVRQSNHSHSMNHKRTKPVTIQTVEWSKQVIDALTTEHQGRIQDTRWTPGWRHFHWTKLPRVSPWEKFGIVVRKSFHSFGNFYSEKRRVRNDAVYWRYYGERRFNLIIALWIRHWRTAVNGSCKGASNRVLYTL